MADFREIFDISKIDEITLGHLEYVLNSPSYADVFRPYLVSMRNTLNQRLLDPSKDRKEEHPDDFLRGGVVAIDGLLHFFEHIVEETRMDRITTALTPATPEQQYTNDAQGGYHAPVLGANESLDPSTYDPAEDI